MLHKIQTNFLVAYIRTCWVLKANKRVSWQGELIPAHSTMQYRSSNPDYIPAWKSVAVQSIVVQKDDRHQGHCKRLLKSLCDDPRFELVVVEGVHDKHLAAALMRWGWDFDVAVSDFYWCKPELPHDVLSM